MAIPWNLTTRQWSDVLLDGADPNSLASRLLRGQPLPWMGVLIEQTRDAARILDLGSGRGENAAVLAISGKRTTLLDWSMENLSFSSSLFKEIRVDGQFCKADMLKPLPFKNGSFDVVYSCGVLEYFTDEEIKSVLQEAARVARKRIIIMIPNALSAAYRLGKFYLEKSGNWFWGGEVPRYTLEPHFSAVGLTRVEEFSVGAKHALNFLRMPLGKTVKAACTNLFGLRDHSRPALLRQGYLLITIGEKASWKID